MGLGITAKMRNDELDPFARIRSLNWKYILKSPSSRIKKKARHRKLPKKRYKRTHPRNGPLGFQENLPSDKCESDLENDFKNAIFRMFVASKIYMIFHWLVCLTFWDLPIFCYRFLNQFTLLIQISNWGRERSRLWKFSHVNFI